MYSPDPYFSRIRENEQHRVVMSLDLESHKCKRVQLISFEPFNIVKN